MRDEICYCKGCGRSLKFITTEKGERMPCNSFPVLYVPDAFGVLLYHEDGTSFRGRIVDKSCTGAALAWEPHWASCANPPERKRKKKAPEPRTKYSSVAEVMAEGERLRQQRRAKEAYDRRVAEERAAREREWAERQTSLF